MPFALRCLKHTQDEALIFRWDKRVQRKCEEKWKHRNAVTTMSAIEHDTNRIYGIVLMMVMMAMAMLMDVSFSDVYSVTKMTCLCGAMWWHRLIVLCCVRVCWAVLVLLHHFEIINSVQQLTADQAHKWLCKRRATFRCKHKKKFA